MSDNTVDLQHAIFVKTSLGQQEMSTRSLGLSPLIRRVMILVDGKRSFSDLAPMTAGQDLSAILQELLAKGCIEVSANSAPSAPAPIAAPEAPAASQTPPAPLDLMFLPEASSRSAKDVEMARNFMTNTVNTIFQANTRLTLLEAIFACKTAEDARRVYPKWAETIASSSIGAKRLPDFREKLFKVL